ncbi:MAG: AAA family ATPase [Candidatus Hodarchaeota archaeon]
MLIRRIRLRNFKPFKDLILPAKNQDFPEGLILIEGRNSSGKSSIVEAILWAFWGSSAIPLSNEDLIRFGNAKCQVTVEFEAEGNEYVIDRSYERGGNMNVVLSQTVDGQKRILASRSGAVDRELFSILRIGYQQALKTLLIRQGEVAELATATPAKLRELIQDVYNLRIFDQVADTLRDDENEVRGKIERIEQDYIDPNVIEQQIDSRRKRMKEVDKEITSLSESEKELKGNLDLLPEAKLIRDVELAKLKVDNTSISIQEENRRLQDKLKDLKIAPPKDTSDMTRIRKTVKADQLKIEQRIANMREKSNALSEDIGRLTGLNRDLEEKIDRLSKPPLAEGREFRCPTCNTSLSLKKKDDIISEYQGIINSNKASISERQMENKKLHTKTEDLDQKRTGLIHAANELDLVIEVRKRIDSLQETASKELSQLNVLLKRTGFSSLDELLSKFSAKTFSDLSSLIQGTQNKFFGLTAEIKAKKSELDVVNEHIKELESQKRNMEKKAREREDLRDLQRHTEHLRKVLMRGFLTEFVVQKRLLGAIKRASAAYLSRFTAGQYAYIDLIPTEARGGAGSGLSLHIEDKMDGMFKRKEQLSFGDRTAVGLALRLGIAQTMAKIRPLKDVPKMAPSVSCVLLDEPLGGLDSVRRPEVIEQLLEDRSFRQIFLVTHTDIRTRRDIPKVSVHKMAGESTAHFITRSSLDT